MSELVDIDHYIGGDFGMSPTGDLASVTGTTRGEQRVLRRLLTNPREYFFQPEYGAGLGQKVGSTLNADEIQALIKGQMLLESVVARSPEPLVLVSNITNGIAVSINYTDAVSLQPAALSFNVTN